jgi:hypothetical protein
MMLLKWSPRLPAARPQPSRAAGWRLQVGWPILLNDSGVKLARTEVAQVSLRHQWVP